MSTFFSPLFYPLEKWSSLYSFRAVEFKSGATGDCLQWKRFHAEYLLSLGLFSPYYI